MADLLFLGGLDPWILIYACAVGLIAGVVKGTVGFALPMIMVSGLSSVLPAELALAALILPTLATNTVQALRAGLRAACETMRAYRIYLIVGGIALFISAQGVRALPEAAFLLIIGIPITGFAALQLGGYRFSLTARTARLEALVGGFAGTMGGLAGIWGPPTVAYLTALNTSKAEQMRVQGVVYALGSFALVAAHMRSGVLRWETLPLSVGMVVPALIGMLIGAALQNRLNQEMFRRITLWVLLIVGLNLIRRGVF